MTTKSIAKAAGIAPRTKRFVVRDEYGFAIDSSISRHLQVLIALNRGDITPDIAQRERLIAIALVKAIETGRINVHLHRRIREQYSPYQVCAVVAKISERFEGPVTIGELSDTWINAHADEL